MNQDFRPHPLLVNYEASRDVVIRNRRLKKPVCMVSNRGYLRFTAGKNTYLCHIIIFECFFGLIKDGFVIDHIDSIHQNNSLENLQAVTHSQIVKRGRTGTCTSVGKRPVNSFDLVNNEEKVFQSMNTASIYFDICRSSIRFVAEGIQKLAISKKNGHSTVFIYESRMIELRLVIII
jgi:hypothetical protein